MVLVTGNAWDVHGWVVQSGSVQTQDGSCGLQWSRNVEPLPTPGSAGSFFPLTKLEGAFRITQHTFSAVILHSSRLLLTSILEVAAIPLVNRQHMPHFQLCQVTCLRLLNASVPEARTVNPSSCLPAVGWGPHRVLGMRLVETKVFSELHGNPPLVRAGSFGLRFEKVRVGLPEIWCGCGLCSHKLVGLSRFGMLRRRQLGCMLRQTNGVPQSQVQQVSGGTRCFSGGGGGAWELPFNVWHG
jgi:hypothetical protein